MRLHSAHRDQRFAGQRIGVGETVLAVARDFFESANSMLSAPIAVIELRKAIDMLLPTTLRSSSVSAVSRDTNSPVRVRS